MEKDGLKGISGVIWRFLIMKVAICTILIITSIILMVLSLKSFIESGDGWDRDASESVDSCKALIKDMEAVQSNKQMTLVFLKKVDKLNESSLVAYESEMDHYISVAEGGVIEARNSVKEAYAELKESEANLKQTIEETVWHKKVVYTRLLLLLGSIVLTVLSFLDYKGIWKGLRKSLLDKPSDVYVITHADGTYSVVSERWRMIRKHETFNSDQKANEYALKLKRETIKGHWHKING